MLILANDPNEPVASEVFGLKTYVDLSITISYVTEVTKETC